MARIRVTQIAKELNIKASEVLERLRAIGVEVKSNLSTVDEEVVARLQGPRTVRPDPKKKAPAAAPATPEAKPIPAGRSRGSAKTTLPRRPAKKADAGKTAKAAETTPTAAKTRPAPTRQRTPPASPRPAGAATARPSAAGTRAPAPSPKSAPSTASKPATATTRVAPGAKGPQPSPRGPAAPGARPSAAGTTQPVTGARQSVTGVRPPTAVGRPGVAGTRRPLSGVRPPVRQPVPAAKLGTPGARQPVTGVRQPVQALRQPTPGARPAPPPGGRAPAQAKDRQVPRTPTQVARGAKPVSGPRPLGPPAAGVARPTAPRRVRPSPAPAAAPPAPPIPEVLVEIVITEGVTVKELSEKIGRKAKDIITKLLRKGILATINQPLDAERAVQVCREFGFDAKMVSFEEDVARGEAQEGVPENLKPRDPVVTIMGHVDHGKTSLLDAIRESNIVARESGGITQHIGAYHIRHKNRGLTFIDTPGHEAFTMMRARGARVTDVVVLVVAADDGVMPQTVEAMDHARAAGVSMVVAVNKVDKPGANIDRVKKQLSDRGLLVEDWGGDVVAVPVSAKQKTGLDDLMDMLLLVTDMAERKADPTVLASGTVLESRLDRARGAVATILVQKGTLGIGDPFIAGAVHGKVRAMFDDRGNRIREVGPSKPVEVLGLEGVPQAGDPFQVLEEEWKVRQIGAFRQQQLRREALVRSSRLTLDHLHAQIKEGNIKDLPIIVKADVQGAVEALSNSLLELPSDKVKIKVIHAGSGAITDSDVILASASNAIIIGYNVRPERSAQELAAKEKVDIRLHSVIYNITSQIKNAMVGLLEPESKEIYMGRAEVRQIFRVPKIGVIAGCSVADGRIVRGAEVRLLRDNAVVHTGKAASLRRFKEDATEVKAGYECGIGLASYNDIKIGDIIEAFQVEKVVVKSL